MSTNSTKTIKGRISNKHGTEEYWILSVYKSLDDLSDTNKRDNPFVPLPGELIIYDPDSIDEAPKFKFGDPENREGGRRNVVDLPFASVEANGIDELDASKVYFEGELKTTYPMGNISLTNGVATLIEEGERKSLRELWDAIYMKESDPTSEPPSCIISVSGGKKEVGETYTYPTATLTANTGNYIYGSIDSNNNKYANTDGTGIVFSIGDVTLKVGTSSKSNSSIMENGDTLGLQASGSSNTYVDGDTKYTFSATAKYTESDRVPLTNLGNKRENLRYGSDTSESKTSITVSNATATFTGYRKSFYGVLSEKETLTDDNIRGICEKLTSSSSALANNSTFTINIPKSTDEKPIYRVLIAYPDTLPEMESVQDKNDSNSNVVSGFKLQKLKVKGANGYTAITYKVYTMDFSKPYDAANTFTVKI